jgi:aspartate racemase
MAKTLGILGGLGPAASVYFYKLITAHTLAKRDQDHLNIVLFSGADIPDRSEYIMGKSDHSPLPLITEDVIKLVSIGADLIAIPCNTAHYFFDEIKKVSPVPVLNIVQETVALAKKAGAKKIGIMATTGTILAGAYQHAAKNAGIDYATPTDDEQKTLMSIIYDSIKTAQTPDYDSFYEIADRLHEKDCDAIILGCTELSLIPKDARYSEYPFIDSLLVLTAKCIVECNKLPCGFPHIYTYVKKED